MEFGFDPQLSHGLRRASHQEPKDPESVRLAAIHEIATAWHDWTGLKKAGNCQAQLIRTPARGWIDQEKT